MNIVAPADSDTASGLRLAGIQTIYEPSKEKTALHYWHEIEENIETTAFLIRCEI